MSGSGIISIFLVSSIVFLLLGLALVFYVTRYQKQMMKQSDELKDKEGEYQQRLIEALIEGQENERTRIASNLHDGLGASLSSIRLSVLMYGEEYPGPTGSGKQFSDDVAELLSDVIQEVRSISHNLLPDALMFHGLTVALNELAKTVSKSKTIAMDLRSLDKYQRLAEKTELALFRICQELVNNTLKHAYADHICLELRWTDDDLILNYSDDGIGFLPHQHHTGLGMHTIDSRVKSIGGRVTFHEKVERGMSCDIQVPIHK